MDELNTSRRLFIKRLGIAAVCLPAFDLGLTSCIDLTESAASKSEEVSWRISTVSADEPGQPLIIAGVVYAPDGRTPLNGISLYVYQTDATGHYSTTNGNNRLTRIHGLMKTNNEGRYEFRTIKPAPYPNHRNPAHIHAYVSGAGYPEYWIDEFRFADDPFITDEQRNADAKLGNFASILKLTLGKDGILRGQRDIRVERCSHNCV